ncbi:MAG: hypothetical protein HXX20_01470 [Chloroflexi bacterium]|nr:hypothetical protein [Chloroflexota bacterium]
MREEIGSPSPIIKGRSLFLQHSLWERKEIGSPSPIIKGRSLFLQHNLWEEAPSFDRR